jgi:hypothetical protein
MPVLHYRVIIAVRLLDTAFPSGTKTDTMKTSAEGASLSVFLQYGA